VFLKKVLLCYKNQGELKTIIQMLANRKPMKSNVVVALQLRRHLFVLSKSFLSKVATPMLMKGVSV